MINMYPIYIRVIRWCFRRMLRMAPYAVVPALSVNGAMYREITVMHTEDNIPTRLSVLKDGLAYLEAAIQEGRDF